MSVVAPNGQIRFLKDVPIDDTYENTLYFDNVTAQTSYFLSLTPVHQMLNCTRVREGVIRVNALADDLLVCNYVMFQNKNFSNKWFYAFVLNVRYINNATTEITYRIDEIQTWLFDETVELKECLIERQHSETDVIGDNIIGEAMGGNELVVGKRLDDINFCSGDSGSSRDKMVILNVSSYFENGNRAVAPIGITDGIANGTLTYAFGYQDYVEGADHNTVEQVTRIIDGLVRENQAESIVGGYVVPYQLFKDFNSTAYVEVAGGGEQGLAEDSDGRQTATGFVFDTSNAYTDLDGYVPKNNKLFTAPFNWIFAMSTDGQYVPVQPQYMGRRNVLSFKNYHCITGVPEARLVLENYKGETKNYENFLAYNNFPQLAYAVDGYKAWVASGGEASIQLSLDQTQQAQQLNQSKSAYEMTSGIAKGIVSGIGHAFDYQNASGKNADATRTDAVLGMVNDGINMADSVMNGYFNFRQAEQVVQFANENADLQRTIARSLPSAVHGKACNTALVGGNDLGLVIEQRCVNENVARAIDNYFTMFGYAQNIVAVPKLKTRKEFTYVKTTGCKVNGGCPSDSINAIQSIFNTGIRFWVNPANVGNYTNIDNGVLV
jgi:hypothetical protein